MSHNSKKHISRLANAEGQNVIEYVLLTAAVVLVLIVCMSTRNGPMQSGLQNVLDQKVIDLQNLNSELQFGNTSN